MLRMDDDQAELDQLSDDAMVGMLQSLDKFQLSTRQ